MKRLCTLTTILLLLLPIASTAEISDDALHSIGKFLIMDFQTASDRNMKKLLSDYFFVKEIGDEIVITKDLILSIPSLSKRIRDKFVPGRYRGIIVINEINGIGCVVREASINEQNQVYWLNETQSLNRFARSPELGNTGVATIMDYENTELLADIFKNVKRGSLPKKWRPKSEELDWYVSTIDVFQTILINRP